MTTKKKRAIHAAAERRSYKKNYYKIRQARQGRHELFKAKKDLFKRSLECANPDCNTEFLNQPEKCEFHHLDPNKKCFSPNKATTWLAFLKEVGKCVPLCSACHNLVELKKKARYRRLREAAEPVPF
ncbi:MAG: hypothetical protein KAS39_04405 [Actinomycetia bacterium]|nr:hypothetical protein [Actinomycetes bacterium]